MQVSKTYSGEVDLEEKTSTRQYSFGYTGTIAGYPSKIDELNKKIAQFLQYECGVDAWYGPGMGNENNFLWIWGVPFLFAMTGSGTTNTTSSYPNMLRFYGPFGASGVTTSIYTTTANTGINLFSGAKFSFGLVFAGNPKTGFYLRFKPYNSTGVSNTIVVRFIKGENLINGATSVLWSARNYNSLSASTTSYVSPLYTGFLAVDMDGAGKIISDSYSNSYMLYTCELYTAAAHRNYNDGALPLVPLTIGPYRANGLYLRPIGFGLPSAVANTVEVQSEITIGDRSFLITASDSMAANSPNMGLIETT